MERIARDSSPIPSQAAFPKVDVSWRQAVAFCNEMSLRDRLEPAYTIADDGCANPESCPTWTPHDKPAH